MADMGSDGPGKYIWLGVSLVVTAWFWNAGIITKPFPLIIVGALWLATAIEFFKWYKLETSHSINKHRNVTTNSEYRQLQAEHNDHGHGDHGKMDMSFDDYLK